MQLVTSLHYFSKLRKIFAYSGFDVDTSNEFCIQLKNLLNPPQVTNWVIVTYPHMHSKPDRLGVVGYT